jgi:hypothetical protein
MLRGIRKASANWLGRTVMGVVMGVLALSFAVWGVNDIFRGYGRSTLAKIGGVEIPIEQFRQLYNERVQQIGRQIGHPLPPEQAKAIGLDRQGSIGVVYGDIGTSPLYALREAVIAAAGPEHDELTRGTVLGVVSLILWALIVVVTLKYVLILLRADNNGEGRSGSRRCGDR